MKSTDAKRISVRHSSTEAACLQFHLCWVAYMQHYRGNLFSLFLPVSYFKLALDRINTASKSYPDVLDEQVKQLLIKLRSAEATDVTNQLKDKVRNYTTGAIPYCSNAFVLLHDKAGMGSLALRPVPLLRVSWTCSIYYCHTMEAC